VSQKAALWDEFQRLGYPVPIANSTPRKNVEECEDDTNIFLGHARVYVFADKYDVAGLRTLALHKLHQTLKVLKPNNMQNVDIIDLVRYGYSNDNTRDNEGEDDMDSLRKLILHFVACMFHHIAEDVNFLELMMEGGPFVRDVTLMLRKRIE
jgi:hypothetical protein